VFSSIPPSAEAISDPIIRGIVESGKRSARLSVIATLVALISIVIATYFSYKDYMGDEKWQFEQISSLRNQVNLLKEQNTILLKTLAETEQLKDTMSKFVDYSIRDKDTSKTPPPINKPKPQTHQQHLE